MAQVKTKNVICMDTLELFLTKKAILQNGSKSNP